MVINFLSPTAEGLVNYFIRMLGKEPINFLISSKYFRGIIIVEEIWKEAGWGSDHISGGPQRDRCVSV